MAREILIVGGGPAGLSTAIELLENQPSASVTIMEALSRANTYDAAYPGAGHSQCSGGLGSQMLDAIGWNLPSGVIMSQVRRAVIRGPQSRAEVHADDLGVDKLGVVMDRKKFDDWLLSRAIKLGATYLPKTRVTNALPCGCGSIDVFTNNPDTPHFQADFIVGADGPESMIANDLLRTPPIADSDMFLASEVYVHAPRFPRDDIELFFDTERLQGYYWAFSGGDIVKVGCGTTRATTRALDVPNGSKRVNVSKEVDWWRGIKYQETFDPGFTGSALAHVGGRITGAAPLRRVVNKHRNVALVGEAARGVWASVGAGDAVAVQTGRALGRALANDDPQEYQRFWTRAARPMLRRHYRMKQALLALPNAKLNRLIEAFASYKPQSTNAQRELPRLLWHIVRREPFMLGGQALRILTQ